MPRHLSDEEFLAKVNAKIVITDKGCWQWTGAKFEMGYGRITDAGRPVRIHRRMYEIARGPIVNGLCVLHKCDNPPCCNPDHLFLGTRPENSKDAVSKNRMASGERSGTAKLKESEAVEIFRLIRFENASKQEVATRFNVTVSNVVLIARRERWRRATQLLATQLDRGKHDEEITANPTADVGCANGYLWPDFV